MNPEEKRVAAGRESRGHLFEVFNSEINLRFLSLFRVFPLSRTLSPPFTLRRARGEKEGREGMANYSGRHNSARDGESWRILEFRRPFLQFHRHRLVNGIGNHRDKDKCAAPGS